MGYGGIIVKVPKAYAHQKALGKAQQEARRLEVGRGVRGSYE